MEQLMAGDQGGRRADIIGLAQNVPSPMHTVTSSSGLHRFDDPMNMRHPAENHSIEDSRHERKDAGYVHWRAEPKVPDVGGVGWRTKTGHMLKNQAYYSSLPNTNLWDLPVHAGVNTWKDWHGPRIRTDAPMMERMDRHEEECDRHEAKKCFVNTTRAQTLDSFYNKKLGRDQLSASQSWAPHRRAKREVNDCHAHFFGDLDCIPEKELKKILTPLVLQRDRDAVRHISSRIQNEETWKMAWRHMEQERRHDIRYDFQQRQAYNDLLMQLSGQPVRQRDWETSLDTKFNNSSLRTEQLSVAKPPAPILDVSQQTDFRGLFHADNEHALETLFPGSGHELSVEFRQRATASTKAGVPPPPAAETPRAPKGSKGCREKIVQNNSVLTTERVPISAPRLDNVAARNNDKMLRKHSKAQFLTTFAPPPPKQRHQLMGDNFSPNTLLDDPGRVTGSFERTEQGQLPHGVSHPTGGVVRKRQSMEHLPPATRSYTYTVLAPASPAAKGAQLSATVSENGSPCSLFQSSVGSQVNMRATNSSSVSFKAKRAAQVGPETTSQSVCRELDEFESTMQKTNRSLPRVSNFFGTPRSHRRSVSETKIQVQQPGIPPNIGRAQTSIGETGRSQEFVGLSRSTSAPVM